MSIYNKKNYSYEYDVLGNFYKINNTDITFRNILNIKRKYISSSDIDATFIITNPQNSSLIDKADIPSFTEDEIINNKMPIILNPCTIGKKEFYIMKAMDDMNLNNVNVLSLSDIVSKDKKDFIYKEGLFKELHEDTPYLHSIFDYHRKDCSFFLNKKSNVICSYDKINDFSAKAKHFFSKNNIKIIDLKREKSSLKENYLRAISSSFSK